MYRPERILFALPRESPHPAPLPQGERGLCRTALHQCAPVCIGEGDWRSESRVRLIGNSPWRERRMDDLAVARQRRRLDDLVVPIDLQCLGLLVDERRQEREQVAGVERARIDGDAARQVEQADDADAVLDHDLAGLRKRAVAALLYG